MLSLSSRCIATRLSLALDVPDWAWSAARELNALSGLAGKARRLEQRSKCPMIRPLCEGNTNMKRRRMKWRARQMRGLLKPPQDKAATAAVLIATLPSLPSSNQASLTNSVSHPHHPPCVHHQSSHWMKGQGQKMPEPTRNLPAIGPGMTSSNMPISCATLSIN